MKPVRSEAHLRFLRTLPCAVCGKTGRTDPAHTGPHGIGTKSSDRDAIPLCRPHHTALDTLGRRKFEAKYGLDIRDLIGQLNETPRIKVEGFAFRGYFQGECYLLGPAGYAFIKPAVRNMMRLAREAQFERMLWRFNAKLEETSLG